MAKRKKATKVTKLKFKDYIGIYPVIPVGIGMAKVIFTKKQFAYVQKWKEIILINDQYPLVLNPYLKAVAAPPPKFGN